MAVCNSSFLDLVVGQAVAAGGAQVHGQLLVVAAGDQRGQRDQRPAAAVQAGPGPDVPRRTRVISSWKSRGELGGGRDGPVDVGVAEHLAPHRHARLVDLVSGVVGAAERARRSGRPPGRAPRRARGGRRRRARPGAVLHAGGDLRQPLRRGRRRPAAPATASTGVGDLAAAGRRRRTPPAPRRPARSTPGRCRAARPAGRRRRPARGRGKPAANQRSAEPATTASVPDARTVAARSPPARGRRSSRRCTAARPTSPGRARRAAAAARPHRRRNRLRSENGLPGRESSASASTPAASSGDAERSAMPGCGRARAGPRPPRGRARQGVRRPVPTGSRPMCRATGPSSSSRPRPRGRRSRCRRSWHGHGRLLEVVAGPLQNGVDEVVDRAEVVGSRRRGRQFGHRPLFGAACRPRRRGWPPSRSASTWRPAISSVVCGGRDDGAPGQGAQGGPFGVPAAVGALVDAGRRRRCAGSRPAAGAVSAARRISTDSTGLRLVRHGRRAAAAAPSASSPISVLLPVATSLAMWPQASQQLTSASPMRVTGAAWCATGWRPRDRRRTANASRRPSAASGEPASSVAAARVPAAPPACAGRGATAARMSAASSTPDEPVGHLRADGARQRRLGQGAGEHRCVLVGLRPARPARAPARRVRLGQRDIRVAQAQHQRGVDDVLAGQPAVQPPGGLAAGAFTQQRDKSDHRVAVGFGARGDRFVSSAAPIVGREVRARLGRCHPGVDKRTQAKHFRRRPSRPEAPCRSSASPARWSPGQNRSVTAAARGSAGTPSRPHRRRPPAA